MTSAASDLRTLLEQRLHPIEPTADAVIETLASGCYIGRDITPHSEVREALVEIVGQLTPYHVDHDEDLDADDLGRLACRELGPARDGGAQ